jgi:hypothetical protein
MKSPQQAKTPIDGGHENSGALMREKVVTMPPLFRTRTRSIYFSNNKSHLPMTPSGSRIIKTEVTIEIRGLLIEMSTSE